MKQLKNDIEYMKNLGTAILRREKIKINCIKN